MNRKPICTRHGTQHATVQEAVIEALTDFDWRVKTYGKCIEADYLSLVQDIRCIVASIAARAVSDEELEMAETL